MKSENTSLGQHMGSRIYISGVHQQQRQEKLTFDLKWQLKGIRASLEDVCINTTIRKLNKIVKLTKCASTTQKDPLNNC